jgi:hypothetical protein
MNYQCTVSDSRQHRRGSGSIEFACNFPEFAWNIQRCPDQVQNKGVGSYIRNLVSFASLKSEFTPRCLLLKFKQINKVWVSFSCIAVLLMSRCSVSLYQKHVTMNLIPTRDECFKRSRTASRPNRGVITKLQSNPLGISPHILRSF